LKLAKSPLETLAQAEAMPRIALLIIILVIIIGALVFLSTVPKQQPTRTIEVAVPADSGGNAH
jgi:energy-converting hydrogenase Eha subunit F